MNADFVGPKPRRPRVLIVVCLLATLAACEPASSVSDEPRAPGDVPFGRGRLWQIEKEGVELSYVFATLQVIDPRLCDLPVTVRQAFDSSPRTAFEFIATPEDEAMLAVSTRLPASRTLEEILGAELFQRAAAIVSDFGPGEDALQRVQPWLLVSMLSMSPVEVRRQSKGVLLLDIWLQRRARRQGKALIKLAEFEEVVAFYDQMSEEDQITLVRDLVAEFPQIDTRVERLSAAYRGGDLARLQVEARDVSRSNDVEAATRFSREMVEGRSHRMIERMLPVIDGGTTFFSLDAVLLPGEEGILRLLEKRGFTVTRLQ